MKDLPNSSVERKNILNNTAALRELYKSLDFKGVLFDQKYRYTKQQVADYFHVDVRTINRLLDTNKDELEQSGQEIFTGLRLKQFKETVAQLKDMHVTQLDEEEEGDLVGARAASLNVFTFKALLNVAMLLQGSDKAKEVRSSILDIVIDVLNKKLGGTTKFVNQREEAYVPSALREFNYRQEFTNALDNYIGDYSFKYSQMTDKIYVSIFKENAKEYRQILKLGNSESVRSTMYSEVLDLISAYENGFADYLKREFTRRGEKLRLSEANQLYREFESLTDMAFQPLKEKARGLMASRDVAFRDALHNQLREYISAVSQEDFERFLGRKSKSLEERLEENMDVFIRLKDK